MKKTKEEQIKVEEKQQIAKKKINPLIIILILLIVAALLVISFILGTQYSNKEKENNEQTQETQHILEAYVHISGEDCEKGDDNCYLAASIPVKNEDSKVIEKLYTDEEDPLKRTKMILYTDGEDLKIYNITTKKIIDTKLKNVYDEYQIQASYNYETANGLVLKTYDETEQTDIYKYYEIKTGEFSLENKYTQIYARLGDYLEVESNPHINDDTEQEDYDWDKYWNNYKVHVYDLKTKKEVITETGSILSFDVETRNDKVYIYKHYSGIGETASTIYNEDYKIILKNKSPHEWGFDKDNNIYQIDGNKVITTNYQGETISTSKEYIEILHVEEDFIMYHDNQNLYITDEKEMNLKVMEWKKGYYYHSVISGYFTGEWLTEVGKSEGYYFTIEYDKKDASGVEVYFNPETKEIKKYELEEIGGYAKPILYLYPEEKTHITINFEKEENLTTTYPKFKDEWNITAYPNGDLYDKDGKYYYGLYWEEDSNHKVDFSEGFYVNKDNAIDFLEEKLSIIGLNDKERNEFIMYWLPILEANEHNLVYFELTGERDAFNEIKISPKPDSLLRMAIHVKKVNGKQTIKEQQLETFKRNGFVAVEWGGIAYK